MGKKKDVLPEKPENELEEELKDFSILSAEIKDGICNYSYEVLRGVGIGDTHNVKGSGVVDNDMFKSFAALNVHMAAIDDSFKGLDLDDIDSMHGEEATTNYSVKGFQVSGGKDNESVVLKGTKYVTSAGGRMELKTPKIPLDNLSSYKWFKELKKAVDVAREEVELYKGGKYTPVEKEEVVPSGKQLTIGDVQEVVDAEFEDAEV